MTTREKLSSDLKTAMINRDEKLKSFIRVILGELDRIDKTLSEEKFELEVIDTLKTMVKAANEMGNEFELNTLATYLPAPLTEDELEGIIRTIIERDGCTSIKEMGKVIGELKSLYNGRYDGKSATDKYKLILGI